MGVTKVLPFVCSTINKYVRMLFLRAKVYYHNRESSVGAGFHNLLLFRSLLHFPVNKCALVFEIG